MPPGSGGVATEVEAVPIMSQPQPNLWLVPPSAEQLRRRFEVIIGREPTPAELKAFVRWRMRLDSGLPLRARRRAARLICRM